MAGFSFDKDLRLPSRLRKRLGKVFYKLIQREDLGRHIKKNDRIFAVGDIVVGTLLEEGYLPHVAVFDYRSGGGRLVIPAIRKRYKMPIIVRNRNGRISKELWAAVRLACKSKRDVGIKVIGEEDLASLACIYFAPIGSVVVYGLRGRGIDFIRVDKTIKKLASAVLIEMRKESQL